MFIDTDTGKILYLDCAATRPTEPEVLRAMTEESSKFPGNPASMHRLGRAAASRLEDLRARFLDLLGCGGGGWKVVFTSGGTEADALALLGSIARFRGGDVVTTSLEHSAVLGCGPLLERMGGALIAVPGDRTGHLDPGRIAAALGRNARLLSVMHTNNEIGTIQPIAEIVREARLVNDKLWIHSDAVQALSHEDLTQWTPHVDLFSLSAHKIGGPRGCGALVFRQDRTPFFITGGGGQQEGVRSGTVDVAAIAGFVRALELEQEGGSRRVAELRDRLWAGIRSRIAGAERNGTAPFAPHILSVRLPGIGSEVVVRALSDRGVCVSAGSACRAGDKALSGTMKSLGISSGWGLVRFSLCRHTTAEQVDRAAALLADVIEDYAL